MVGVEQPKVSGIAEVLSQLDNDIIRLKNSITLALTEHKISYSPSDRAAGASEINV